MIVLHAEQVRHNFGLSRSNMVQNCSFKNSNKAEFNTTWMSKRSSLEWRYFGFNWSKFDGFYVQFMSNFCTIFFEIVANFIIFSESFLLLKARNWWLFNDEIDRLTSHWQTDRSLADWQVIDKLSVKTIQSLVKFQSTSHSVASCTWSMPMFYILLYTRGLDHATITRITWKTSTRRSIQAASWVGLWAGLLVSLPAVTPILLSVYSQCTVSIHINFELTFRSYFLHHLYINQHENWYRPTNLRK